ncbi:hypothetical protein PFISCL1PPCAC_2723, partial [Pristionchus fissidentatus]
YSMPPKKKDKGRKDGVTDRPRNQQSLFVAFAKQIKLTTCTICSEEFAAGVFAAHKRDCRVKEDDDECQVLFSQTAEQKWAAGLITLDGDENKVKREQTTPTTSDRAAHNRQSTSSVQQRRRATKRRIEDGESGGDDSDFALGSQEVKEEREREEPVRTRRSARLSLPADVSMAYQVLDEMESATGGDQTAAAAADAA